MTSPIADIEGKYEILAKLSEGGMGAIYQVRHRLLDEVRVVKVLRQQHAEDDELRRRFAHEARAAIRLRHPNVVQIFDFSVDEEGNGLIVMEHIAEHQLTEADRHLFQLAEEFGDSARLGRLRRRLEEAFGGDLESQLQSLLQEAEERVEADEYPVALDLIRKAEIMVPEEGDVRRRCMEGIEELKEEIEARERRRGLEELEAHVERSLRAGELEGLEIELEQARTTYGSAGDTAVGRLEELLDRRRLLRAAAFLGLLIVSGIVWTALLGPTTEAVLVSFLIALLPFIPFRRSLRHWRHWRVRRKRSREQQREQRSLRYSRSS